LTISSQPLPILNQAILNQQFPTALGHHLPGSHLHFGRRVFLMADLDLTVLQMNAIFSAFTLACIFEIPSG
jgi:hypothetical protein